MKLRFLAAMLKANTFPPPHSGKNEQAFKVQTNVNFVETVGTPFALTKVDC